MSKKSTIFAAKILIKQINDESPQSIMWLISSINRMLIVDENISLSEFKNIVKEMCPKRFEEFKYFMNEKGLYVVD
jgi:hypothetical protein